MAGYIDIATMKKTAKDAILATGEIVRALNLAYQTDGSRLNRGLFPVAIQEQSPRRPYWPVPAIAAQNVEPTATGRSQTPWPELTNKLCRNMQSN
jgi:hypothetical protein